MCRRRTSTREMASSACSLPMFYHVLKHFAQLMGINCLSNAIIWRWPTGISPSKSNMVAYSNWEIFLLCVGGGNGLNVTGLAKKKCSPKKRQIYCCFKYSDLVGHFCLHMGFRLMLSPQIMVIISMRKDSLYYVIELGIWHCSCCDAITDAADVCAYVCQQICKV